MDPGTAIRCSLVPRIQHPIATAIAASIANGNSSIASKLALFFVVLVSGLCDGICGRSIDELEDLRLIRRGTGTGMTGR